MLPFCFFYTHVSQLKFYFTNKHFKGTLFVLRCIKNSNNNNNAASVAVVDFRRLKTH